MRIACILILCCNVVPQVSADVFHIGSTSIKGSIAFEHLRYAVDRWNTENGAHTQIRFEIVAAGRHGSSFEDRMCEMLQHGVVAVVLSPDEDSLDVQLVKSMCHHFRIPCISLQSSSLNEAINDYVTVLGPGRGIGARATSQFLDSLRWPGFLLAYQSGTDLEDLAPLMYYRGLEATGGRRLHIKVRRLPNNTDDYEPFLKYVKNRLKQTNIIIHSNNITVLYTLLQQARGLNMTETPFSYVFTNTDLSLLEDFLNNMYGAFHCNITGLQLVKNDPMMKTRLALTSEAAYVIGMAIFRMREMGHAPRETSLMCDLRETTWNDGPIMNEGIRKIRLRNQLTGDVQFKANGEREDLMYHGVGRINSQFVKVS
ncbi:unnamed protein product [Caenorhabditis auriculariae]|uniref:Receptor ligand binding region domain-containing protein n=1 Tax=Caenorhabditis auriculariae TaxID=2777116 RepID=A0A8S1HBC1_9PELO|nr:unnamed protein product [Caenorhabditis auriculariae]